MGGELQALEALGTKRSESEQANEIAVNSFFSHSGIKEWQDAPQSGLI